MAIGISYDTLKSKPGLQEQGGPQDVRPHKSQRWLDALLVLAVLAALALFFGAITGGFRIDTIETGSMRPKLPVHSDVILVPESVSAITKGQILAFTPPAPWNHETVVHEVISVKRRGQWAVIRTKGIANPVADPWKAIIKGQAWHVVGDVPLLGYLTGFARIGWVQVLVIIGLFSLGVQAIRKMLKRRSEVVS